LRDDGIAVTAQAPHAGGLGVVFVVVVNQDLVPVNVNRISMV
jgi:hypothetical protein